MNLNAPNVVLFSPVESSEGESIFGEHLGQVLKDVGGVQVAVVVQIQLSNETFKKMFIYTVVGCRGIAQLGGLVQ